MILLKNIIPDHLSSNDMVTNNTGNIIETSDYEPYGKVYYNQEIQNTGNEFRFVGKEFDLENTLQYFGARYMENALGRFYSVDPLMIDILNAKKYNKETNNILVNPQALHSYAYARSNPIMYTDPFGLWNQKTGEVEKGDTLSDITKQINKIYGTNYNYDTIARLSKIDDPDKINAGQVIKPNSQTPDVTNLLNAYNKSFADMAIKNDFGYSELAFIYSPGGPGDFKQNPGTFCQDTECGGQQHKSYVFIGQEIDPDAPANINFGYVGNAAGLDPNLMVAGGTILQNGVNLWNKVVYRSNAKVPTLDLKDNAYILYGYNLYDN